MTALDGRELAAGEVGGSEVRGRGDRVARWLVVPLLVVLLVLLVVFFILFQTVQVAGPSMLPGLRPGDYLLVTKGYPTPVRGEIVVIAEKQPDGRTIDVIKRVVGVGGDSVEVLRGVAIVNGSREPTRAIVTGGNEGWAPSIVPAGEIFVLGDNRPVSYDSRYYGPVPLGEVKGRAVFRFAPLQRMGPVR